MRLTARQRSTAFTLLLYLLVTLIPQVNTEGIPIEIKLWDTGRTPLAHMVDVTNGFGLKVLAEHNFLNENNIAFSPYGLLGILVALYEGVDGESSYQIQRAMQLPWNRNVMRIGFRDIHRTLKTYFVPEEGFLAGLALNNENVTFNEEYKTILRFYGFDLDRNEQIPTLAPPSNETNLSTVLPVSAPSVDPSLTVGMTTEAPSREDTSTQTPKIDTTLNPNSESVNEIDIRGLDPALTTAAPTSAITEAVANTVNSGEQQATLVVVSSTEAETQITTQATSSAETTSNMPVAEETTPIATLASSGDAVIGNNDVEVLSTQVAPDMTAEITATTAPMATDIITTTATDNSENVETETPATVTEPSETPTDMSITDLASAANDTNIETLQRRKKSVVDFIFSHPPYVDDYLIYKAYEVPLIEAGPKPFSDNMFLVNGLRNVQVTYMHYDTVLDHAYLPHLEASALRLPLDSERYYLLVILPARGGPAELGRLIGRMARESDLSDVYTVLRPRRVHAVVPSFTVKGHITLTTDLQKLGIRDVFEPRQRDFTPMTRQGGVYVRSVEQAVSVAIRKYQPTDRKTNRYVNYPRVQFSATYPFLYFVMDATIHVALMAGKMVDPLNSRIL